jgi:hypothetical protein
MLLSGTEYRAEKAFVLWDTVHSIRFCCVVGYKGRITKLLGLGYYRKKTLLLYPTTEEKLLPCGI